MDVPGLLISLGFSLGAVVFGAWQFLSRLKSARYMLNTPTSKIRSAAQGYVELYGVVETLPSGALVAPLTGASCVWWRFRIEQERERGKDSAPRWQLVQSGSSDAFLRFSDGTGECLIDPRGAQVHTNIRQVWLGNKRHPRGLVRQSWLSKMAAGNFRYTEERLQAGSALYAIGDFRTLGAVTGSLDQAQADLVRQWKLDFAGLLKRFDSNLDGRLDSAEWQRVRESARAQAQRQLQKGQQLAPQHQLAKPAAAYPFVLSTSDEKTMARRFYWQALGFALLCLGGALATVWLVNDHWLPYL